MTLMAHQYSRVGFNSSVEVNKVNLSLSYGGVIVSHACSHNISCFDCVLGGFHIRVAIDAAVVVEN